MHTMVSLTDDCTMDNSLRSMWYTPSSTETKDNEPPQQACFIFGGINQKKRINNDLWLIEPDAASNKKDVYNEKGEYLFMQSANKIYLKIRKV